MYPDFAELRREFPVLANKTYLNTGSYCALAKRVTAAIQAYLDCRLQDGADWGRWMGMEESIRSLTAQLFGVHKDEIAITASASAGINALASALSFAGPRDKVIVSDFEFPTNAQIWHAQEPRGARVFHVPPASDGFVPLEHFEERIDERTLLVAVTHLCYRNGAKLDIPGIVKLAHAKGALVLLDCYQSAGAIDIDFDSMGVDFAVGGMLKYLLATAGIGFMFVRQAHIETLVPFNSGWMAQNDVSAMDIHANRPAVSARRFQAGTPPIVNCYAAEAGLRMLLSVGMPFVEKRVMALTEYCMRALAGVDWPSVTPERSDRRGPLIAVKSRNSEALCRSLLEQGIVTSHRDGNVRASFHFYNDEADAERFVAAMRQARQEFK